MRSFCSKNSVRKIPPFWGGGLGGGGSADFIFMGARTFLMIQKPGNHPNFAKKKKSSRSEKVILGATLGIPGHSRSNLLGMELTT